MDESGENDAVEKSDTLFFPVRAPRSHAAYSRMSHDEQNGSPTQFSPQVTTETIPHSEDSLSFNYSDVYVASGTNLTTNGSYVARIALADPRAQQLFRSGGKIEGIDKLNDSVPTGIL